MKTIPKLQPLMVAALLSVTFFVSCSKETTEETTLTPEEETQSLRVSSESSAEADNIFTSLFDDVLGVNDEVGIAGLGIFGSMTPSQDMGTNRTTACFNVSINRLNAPQLFPVEVVIDFGSGCTGRDGITRSGKMKTIYTNRLLIPGAKATTSFENFKVNDIAVSGTHEILNTSSSTTLQFKVAVVNGKLIKPNGNYIEWNSQKATTQTGGLGTPFYPLDDVYHVEGHSNGKAKRSDFVVAWKNEITQPLVKKFNCRWFTQGTISTQRENNRNNNTWVAELDFGNGVCDNKAIITINGSVFEISLH